MRISTLVATGYSGALVIVNGGRVFLLFSVLGCAGRRPFRQKALCPAKKRCAERACALKTTILPHSRGLSMAIVVLYAIFTGHPGGTFVSGRQIGRAHV